MGVYCKSNLPMQPYFRSTLLSLSLLDVEQDTLLVNQEPDSLKSKRRAVHSQASFLIQRESI